MGCVCILVIIQPLCIVSGLCVYFGEYSATVILVGCVCILVIIQPLCIVSGLCVYFGDNSATVYC